MFLLVSGRNVGAHLGGHQHGGSIQISINLRKTFLLISSVRKVAVTGILEGLFAYLPRETLFLPLEHKIHIFEPTCNVLFVIWRIDIEYFRFYCVSK